jgi:hypothetical protein
MATIRTVLYLQPKDDEALKRFAAMKGLAPTTLGRMLIIEGLRALQDQEDKRAQS